MNHLLGIRGLSREDAVAILDAAPRYREISEQPVPRAPLLVGRTVTHLFLEPSTRTQASFQLAAKRLSAEPLSFSARSSSLSKGETFLDTARTLASMAPDIIVVRSRESGAPGYLAREIPGASVVNAGDGMNEHPTQALLDAFTIRERRGRIEGLTVAIIGDLLHSRVFRSNARLLTLLGARVRCSGPPPLMPPGLERLGVEPMLRVEEALEGADAVMVLRIQHERMHASFIPSEREYYAEFGLTAERLALTNEALVLHPGPLNRGVEIASEVADGPQSVILEQVRNGVAVRMAVLVEVARSRAGGRRAGGRGVGGSSDGGAGGG